MRYIISLALASALALSLALSLALAPAAGAEGLRVVTDIPPVHALVAMVLGDRGTADLILSPGADVHDLQLTPGQAAMIAEADLAVWSGPAMTPWFAEALAALGPDGGLALLTAPGTQLRPAVAGHDHSHDHDQGHDQGQDHAGIDPHAWLDPANARTWVALIAARLAAADPAGEAVYRANAGTAAARIDAAEAAAAARLAPVAGRVLVVQHDAYGYFAARFGLTVLGAITEGDAAPPGAQRLAALRAALQGAPGACIYPEANHDPALAAGLAADTGLPLGPPLDPEGATLPPGADLYPLLLESLAAAIAACPPAG